MSDLNALKEQIDKLTTLEAVELLHDLIEGRLKPKEARSLEERLALAQFDIETSTKPSFARRMILVVSSLAVGMLVGFAFIFTVKREAVAAKARALAPVPPTAPVKDPATLN